MGMKDLSFYISWVLYYLIKYTIISLVVALILAKQVFVNSNFLVIFLWHWLFVGLLSSKAFLYQHSLQELN